jgi:DNA invertase Pin-like site-specific DNA recombinase
MKYLIAYYRVSTQQQGKSGLGLEAQEAAVIAYAQTINATIKASFIEVESGKRNDRPQLQAAIATAKRSKAVLCVAKLDRLSRNMAFLATVLDSGVEFSAADMPAANKFMLHVMAAVAEHEAAAISTRTRAALQAAKARGQQLGSNRPGHWEGREQARLDGLEKGRKASATVRTANAKNAIADLLPIMQELRAQSMSFQAIADQLNTSGHTTRRGCQWNAIQVKRAMESK